MRNNQNNWMAGGTIAPSSFVYQSAAADNKCLQSGANGNAIGICQEAMRDPPGTTGADITIAARAGDRIDVFGLGDVCNVKAGSAITRGDELKSDAAGLAVPIATTGVPQNVCAIALESIASGAKGKVLIVKYQTVGAAGGDLNLLDDQSLILGTGLDAEVLWSTADASDHGLVLALGDTSQMLHVTDLAAKASDWAITSPTHPTVYIHSNTTPTTDYLAIGGHDGTTAGLDVVGGTVFTFSLASTQYASVRITGLAVGTYVQAATAGTDQLTLKSTGTAPASTGANVGHLFADFETDDDELFWLSGTNGTATQLTT